MTPDYTYGHTQCTKSVNDYLTSQGGWAQVTDQRVSPLGTQDFSQYLRQCRAIPARKSSST